VFVPMSTMNGLASNPTSCPYLIGTGPASPGKTSRAIDSQMGCSCTSKAWARLSLANSPFENLSFSSARDVFPGEHDGDFSPMRDLCNVVHLDGQSRSYS
jgi:hypothetical protein